MRDEGDDKGLPDNGDRFTVAEMHDSIEALSDPDVAKLVAASRAFCRLCGIPPDDLLQEAYTRALEGRRTCHRGTGIVEFLCGVMKSLASQENEARKEGLRPVVVMERRTGPPGCGGRYGFAGTGGGLCHRRPRRSRGDRRARGGR
jgi:hypothetical protein